jgi:multiple sugar transport system substrate-binding protein
MSGAAAVAAGGPKLLHPRPAKAKAKQLKILQWKHFVPGYDEWFNETYVTEWGAQNQIEVIVENIPAADLGKRALAEIAARSGHDLVQFAWSPPAAHEDYIIDHREIYDEVERRFGDVAEFALKSTYSPKTGKYFGVCHSYGPPLITYRKDLWDGVQLAPDSWANVLTGGRHIKFLQEKPVGISLAPEHNAEHTLRAILYSFGASEQDAEGNPALKSDATLEAIRYVKALYEEAMTPEVLGWDAASNNRFMANGEGSLTLDTISIARASEKATERLAGELRLAPAPAGPATRRGPAFGLYMYVIWNFAENIDTAKQFIIDYMAHLRQGFLASEFQNMPTVAALVPDLQALLAADPAAGSTGKYDILSDGLSWTTNLGAPGFTNAAIVEVLDAGTISRMFAQAATGELSPDEALARADAELTNIFQKWREKGKL